MLAAQVEQGLPSRAAVRFLWEHGTGQLMTTDPVTGEPRFSPVSYVGQPDGSFLVLLPADSPQAEAIRTGAEVRLIVRAPDAFVPDALMDDAGLLTTGAIRQVSADVDTESIEDNRVVSALLTGETEDARDDDAAVKGLAADLAASLVAVRLHIRHVHVELRESVAA
jgi:hypothetical protein